MRGFILGVRAVSKGLRVWGVPPCQHSDRISFAETIHVESCRAGSRMGGGHGVKSWAFCND